MRPSEKDTIKKVIKLNEDHLKRYALELEKQPNSTFYLGLVKNTEEYIEELKKMIKD